MPHFFQQLILEETPSETQESSFWHDQELSGFSYLFDDDKVLEYLVFKVRRNPKNLISHVRRIYFCHEKSLQSQLFAALLDFLIILQGKGERISRRMLYGCRHLLDQQQLFSLEVTLTNDLERLGNPFCLFTTGKLGSSELVEYKQQNQQDYDILDLANDFIEFSQLDLAMEVLEGGIIVNSERKDLQHTLLQLYLSTRNQERLLSFYHKMSASGIYLSEEWRLATNSFEG